jgi:hypothetical protein
LTPSLPLDAYTLGNQQEAEMEVVGDTLEKRCMNDYGYSWNPTLTPSFVLDEIRIDNEIESREWGITDMTVARTFGYHLPSWLKGPGSRATVNSLSSSEQYALLGMSFRGSAPVGGVVDGHHVPAGGCHGESMRILARSGLSDAQTAAQNKASSLSQQAFLETQVASKVQTAFRTWSSCMRSRGYDIASPFKAAALFAPRPGKAGQVEIETAVADIECKLRTHYLPTVYGVMASIERGLINRNFGVLAQARAQVAAEGRQLAKLAVKYDLP